MDSSKEAGLAVKHRRQMLRMTIAEASALGDVSTTTWTNVEAGKPVTQDTVIGVAQALGWRQDWLERLLSGEPVVLALDPIPQAPVQQRADAWEQQQGQTVKEWRESVESRLAKIENMTTLMWVAIESLKPTVEGVDPIDEIEQMANQRDDATVTPLRPKPRTPPPAAPAKPEPERRAALDTDAGDDVERGAPTHKGGRKKPRSEG